MEQTILVIDEEVATRESIANLLERKQFQVLQAETGQQGIQQASTDHPNLIICDVMLPDIDGFTVLDVLRKSPETSLIPFVFLTAKDSHQYYRQGMELGADDYLLKPFTNEELLKAIDSRLKKQSQMLQHLPSKGNQQIDSLKKQLEKLQKTRELEEELFSNFFQDLRSSLSKINLAIYLLKQENDDEKRERYLNVLKEECHWEMDLLDKVEELRSLVTPDNLQFLQRYNLLANYRTIEKKE